MNEYAAKLLELAKQEGLTDKNMQAILLSQAHYETGGFTAFEENLKYSRAMIKRLRPGLSDEQAQEFSHDPVAWGNYYYSDKPGDKRGFANGIYPNSLGYLFRGRGCAQLTGKNNYISYMTYRHFSENAYQDKLDSLLNSIANPDSDECYLSAIWFYTKVIGAPETSETATRRWVGNIKTLAKRELLYKQYLKSII